jgi:hypothetical protein
MLMAAAKFQWYDLAARLLGEANRRAVAIKAGLPGSIYPPVFCRKLNSDKAENQIVEVERKPLS